MINGKDVYGKWSSCLDCLLTRATKQQNGGRKDVLQNKMFELMSFDFSCHVNQWNFLHETEVADLSTFRWKYSRQLPGAVSEWTSCLLEYNQVFRWCICRFNTYLMMIHWASFEEEFIASVLLMFFTTIYYTLLYICILSTRRHGAVLKNTVLWNWEDIFHLWPVRRCLSTSQFWGQSHSHARGRRPAGPHQPPRCPPHTEDRLGDTGNG